MINAIQTSQITKIWKLVQENIKKIDELESKIRELEKKLGGSPDISNEEVPMYKRRKTNELGEYVD